MGSLEDSVMRFLWTQDGAATTAEVHAEVGTDLAYTTVMTILTRLWKKGQVERDRVGRAYAYRPVRSEADHEAGRMRKALDSAGDREAALSSFTETLSESDLETLRSLLDEG
jgi:predicted transcriptional regulator